MAKPNTVSYKMGIDSMRGKLATKQTDIRYSGQKEGQKVNNMEVGVHAATNFDKYLVLTTRRGKDMFYVKSRTTVNNTPTAMRSKSLFALAATMSDPLAKGLAQLAQDPARLQTNEIIKAYTYYRKPNQTLREWCAGVILEAINLKMPYIETQSAPDENGNVRQLTIMDNPFVVWNATTQYLDLDPEQLGSAYNIIWTREMSYTIRRNLKQWAGYLGKAYKEMEVIVDTGRKYTLGYIDDANTLDFELFAEQLQGEHYIAQESIDPEEPGLILTIVDDEGKIKAQGTLYTDAAMTTLLVKTTKFNTLETVYLKVDRPNSPTPQP